MLPALAGLPRILVDIRHEASHNELPSLALLRLGAATALAWLSQSYWQQQADHLTLRKSQIHELLQVQGVPQLPSLGAVSVSLLLPSSMWSGQDLRLPWLSAGQ